MLSSQPFFSNVLDIVWSVAVCALYSLSTVLLGARLAPRLSAGWRGTQLAIRYTLGAAVLGTVFTLLACLKLAYFPVVLAIALLPLALGAQGLGRVQWPVFRESFRAAVVHPRAAELAAAVGITALVSFAVVMSLALPRGGDVAIYHLVIPRSVLWHHGLVFNPFSHDAGIFYGWQLYALPAYFLDADRAFLLCSTVAFGILLYTAYAVLWARYGRLTGMLGALVVAAVICGMSRESIINNDVPLVVLEVGLLCLACLGSTSRRSAVLLGLAGGFIVAVKLVAIAAPALGFAIFLWRRKGDRIACSALLAICGSLAVLPWLLYNYFSSGTPLAHFLMAWPPATGYLPHYRETIPYMLEQFGRWYQFNIGRFFTQGMEFFPVLLAGWAVAPFVRAVISDRMLLALAGYAVLRALVLLALNRFDLVLLYHDRYHLISYLFIALGGLICWVHLCRRISGSLNRESSGLLAGGVLLATANLFLSPVMLVDVRVKGEPEGSAYQRPLYWITLVQGYHALLAPGGGSRVGVGFDVASPLLPRDAVVATTVIDPYLIQRRFMQMLPVSQNLIDLSLPPEALREAMVRQGATHLYLTQYSGLNAWMEPKVDRWIETLRKVPDLAGVRRLITIDYPISHGPQGFYDLRGNSVPTARPAIGGLADVHLSREAEGTWAVRWRPEAGVDVRVSWRETPDRLVRMGEAASELGWFPLRLRMPRRFELEVSTLDAGRGVQTVVLTPPE